MAGKWVHYVYSVPANALDPSGPRIYVEEEMYCCRPDEQIKVGARWVNLGGPIRVFRADENRAVDLVQFWSNAGGKRTIELRQVLGAYAKPHLKRD